MICLHTEYCFGDQEDEIVGTCGFYKVKGIPYRILVGKHEGNRPPGTPKHRW